MQPMMKFFQNKKLLIIFRCAILLCILVMALVYIYVNYYKLMNGDTSSELVLGKHLYQNGSILSKGWIYSTEIKVLNAQIIYKLVYPFFANNWLLYRMGVDAIMLIVLVASYLFMMFAIGLFDVGLRTSWILPLPFSASYGYVVAYGVFYTPYIISHFFLLD